MTDRKTVSISSDPAFIKELSEYLEVLANPARLQILQIIATGPQETSVIASRLGTTYQNAKKHLDRLTMTGLVCREAGFGRETERGVAPVWKFSLVPGGMERLIRTLGIFSSVAAPLGYHDAIERIRTIRDAVANSEAAAAGPVLYLIGGEADGRAFILSGDRTSLGREDPSSTVPVLADAVILPDTYRGVTRIGKPHAVITRTSSGWQIGDHGSTGGTYINSRRLQTGEHADLSTGDVIDLSLDSHGARLLFVAP